METLTNINLLMSIYYHLWYCFIVKLFLYFISLLLMLYSHVGQISRTYIAFEIFFSNFLVYLKSLNHFQLLKR
jgi:cell shape-determining protein MreC